MNISLTPELEKFIHAKVDAGLYTSANEVIRESLRLLSMYEGMHKKSLEQLNNEINKGLLASENRDFVDPENTYNRLQKKINSPKQKS